MVAAAPQPSAVIDSDAEDEAEGLREELEVWKEEFHEMQERKDAEIMRLRDELNILQSFGGGGGGGGSSGVGAVGVVGASPPLDGSGSMASTELAGLESSVGEAGVDAGADVAILNETIEELREELDVWKDEHAELESRKCVEGGFCVCVCVCVWVGVCACVCVWVCVCV